MCNNYVKFCVCRAKQICNDWFQLFVLGFKPKEDVFLSRTIQGLFDVNPPIALLNSTGDLCRRHSQIYIRELEKLTIWALKSK